MQAAVSAAQSQVTQLQAQLLEQAAANALRSSEVSEQP